MSVMPKQTYWNFRESTSNHFVDSAQPPSTNTNLMAASAYAPLIKSLHYAGAVGLREDDEVALCNFC